MIAVNRKVGTLFWNELSMTPVFDEADHLMYFIGVHKINSGLILDLPPK